MDPKDRTAVEKTEREQRLRLVSAAMVFLISSLWTLYIFFSPDLMGLAKGLANQRVQMIAFEASAGTEERFRSILLGQIELAIALLGFLRLSLILLGLACFVIGAAITENYVKTKRLLDILKKQ